MFAFGLIVSVCYIPGWTGVSLPTQWAVLSCLLPFGLWRPAIFGPAHWLGLVSLGWASATFFWTPNFHDWGFGFWLVLIWAGGFWLGSTMPDLSALYRGFALGLAVSSTVAFAQWFGWNPVLRFDGPNPAGLFFNPTVLGATAALVALGLIQHRLWWWLPGVFPALALAQSRGAWVAFAIGLCAHLRLWPLIPLALTALALYFGLSPSPSDTQRLYLWGLALSLFNPWGHGIGSFESLTYIATDTLFHTPVRFVRPEYVHNDYIQILFELGIGSAPIFLLATIAVLRGGPLSIGAATLALFYFPLWCPTTALLATVVAGDAAARWHLAGSPGFSWGPDSLLRAILRRSEPDGSRPVDFPVQSPP